jgi:type I restriction enzyme S subunit
VITETFEHISEEAQKKTNLTIHPANTFLMAITGLEAAGTRGSCAILGVPATTNQSCMAVYGTEKLDVKYLFYYYSSNGDDLAFRYCQGTKQQSYTASIVKKLPIILPPIDEQKRIAVALSEIDKLITTLDRQLAKKRAIKQGTMQELLTGKKRLPGFNEEWVKTKIGSMAEVYSGGTPNTSEPACWGGKIPWMNSGELNLKIVRQVQGRITKAGMESSSTHFIPAECVLIGLAGQGKTRGTAAFNTFPLCTNQSIAAIYPNPNKFNSKFLYYKMDTQYEQLRELSSGDGGRGGLNKKLILNYDVTLPQSIDEQTAIAAILTEMDDEIENMEKKLAKYRQVKQGMMQQLLTGKIRLV